MPQSDLAHQWTGAIAGDTHARDRLLAQHYDEFRRLARRSLNGGGARLAIQPTDLAHEAAIRILGIGSFNVRDQTHFLALAARVMRTTLIDEVRRQKAAKRGPGVVTLWNDQIADVPGELDIEAFDGVLEHLAIVDGESARIVELRFYAGLTLEEIAETMAISLSTVHRRWRAARAWLLKELQK